MRCLSKDMKEQDGNDVAHSEPKEVSQVGAAEEPVDLIMEDLHIKIPDIITNEDLRNFKFIFM